MITGKGAVEKGKKPSVEAAIESPGDQLPDWDRARVAQPEPRLRLHLWLETKDGLFFGIGRAQLLAKVEEHGSLRKAAEDLGMSYRAAWGKIKKTEKVLGAKLVERSRNKKEGYQLTELGKLIMTKFLQWFNGIEQEALTRAREIFP